MLRPTLSLLFNGHMLRAYYRFFKEVGKPETIISDNSSSFICKEAKEFYKDHRINHHTCPSYRPQSNGLVERLNRTVRERVKMVTQQTGSFAWSKHLNKIMNIYNDTPHSITKFTPIYLMKGQLSDAGNTVVDNEKLEKRQTKSI